MVELHIEKDYILAAATVFRNYTSLDVQKLMNDYESFRAVIIEAAEELERV